jgi:hypothetical protein
MAQQRPERLHHRGDRRDVRLSSRVAVGGSLALAEALVIDTSLVLVSEIRGNK